MNWNAIMREVEKIEALKVKGFEDLSTNPKEPVEYSFAVEISDKQCLIHKFVSPQYYGEDTDFLKLYDCNNTDKKSAVEYAIITFKEWLKIHQKQNK